MEHLRDKIKKSVYSNMETDVGLNNLNNRKYPAVSTTQ